MNQIHGTWWLLYFKLYFGWRTSQILLIAPFKLRIPVYSWSCSHGAFSWVIKLLMSYFSYRSLHHPGNATPTERGGAKCWQHGSRWDARPGPEPSERGSDQWASGPVPSTCTQPAASTGEKEWWGCCTHTFCSLNPTFWYLVFDVLVREVVILAAESDEKTNGASTHCK